MATNRDSSVLESVREAMDSAVNGTVFGRPITQNGVTVLPAAKVSGGGGGGGGTGKASDSEHDVGSGSGGGLGMSGRPLGVFVIKGGSVKWRPALDANKVILGGQIVAAVALLTVRAIVRARRRRRFLRR